MAKMFYTIDEVCEKLGKSSDEVREMASSGQIQEFRDRDKLMFKVEQIDLLAGGEEEIGEIPLSLEESNLGDSGIELQDSNIALADSREGTGISVFDTDHGDVDPSDQTATSDLADDELSLEAVGSGSGLLDLTRESDETTLGAELLEEVYASDDNVDIPANASGLFEAAHVDAPEIEPAAAMAPMVMEAYDGSGSGLGLGLMVGALVALVCVAIVGIVGVSGATPQLATMMGDSSGSLMIWGGGLLGATIIFGLIGLFIGKATG
jgi:hypothetical protein